MTPYYEDDAVTIYHGDCRDVLAEIADLSADVVFADPPDVVGRIGEDHVDRRGGKRAHRLDEILLDDRVERQDVDPAAGADLCPFALVRWRDLLDDPH